MNSSTQEAVNLSDKLLLRVNVGVLGPDAGPGGSQVDLRGSQVNPSSGMNALVLVTPTARVKPQTAGRHVT